MFQDVDELSFFIRRTQGWQNNNLQAIGNTGLFFHIGRSRKISMLCLSTGLVHGVFQTRLRQRHIRSVIEDEICKLFTLSAFRKTSRKSSRITSPVGRSLFNGLDRGPANFCSLTWTHAPSKVRPLSRSPRSRFNPSTKFRSLRSKWTD